VSYRPPRSEEPASGRGRQQPARAAGRTPAANAGRVVGGRTGGQQDRYPDRDGSARAQDRDRSLQDGDRSDRDRYGRPSPDDRRGSDKRAGATSRSGSDRAVATSRAGSDSRSGAASRSASERRAASDDRASRDNRPGPHNRRKQRTSDARWQPLPDPAPRSGRGVGRRPGLVGGKVLVALFSALVLVGTGYYANKINSFTDGLTTANVIEAPQVEKPSDGATDILMVGMDSRTDAQGHPLSKEQLAVLNAGKADGVLNTDTLILMRIPNDGGPATGISVPRDSYVDIPGYGEHKINSAYARAKNDAMRNLRDEGVTDEAELQVRSNQEGAKKLIETIQDLTGATIDHYAEVNLLGFYDITNAIGGIDVCLNAPVKDKYSGANFQAGQQTLSGAPALAFVRQRHGLPNGDLDRIVRQQVFMSGMAKKVLSGDMLAPGSDTFGKLQTAIQKSVVLDADWNVMQFAQQMMGVTGGQVKPVTIPHGTIDLKTPNDGSAVEIDPDAVRTFVAGLLGNKGKTSTTGTKTQDDAADNGKITVNVRNTTNRGGLAKSVATALVNKGFVRGETGNAENRPDTVVRYAAGEQDYGNRVNSALGGKARVEEDANLPAGSVSVLIGDDYSGPGASGSDSGAEAGERVAGQPLLNLSGPQVAAAAQPATPQAGCVN
jgi:LCP family protein required for cell wall assembly